jgi:uncharacterized protein (DUF169 family)
MSDNKKVYYMSIQKKLEKTPHQQSYINILERNNYQFELMDEVGISNKITKAFKELLHLAPVGVNFYFSEDVDIDSERPVEPLRFCQAVERIQQTSRNMLLTKEDISCPAARVVLGFEENDRILTDCAAKLVEARRFNDEGSAIQALMDVPRIRGKTRSVLLSTSGVLPDVYVFYLRPVELMQVVQAYQRVIVQPIRLNVTGVMPVCGNCTVRPYVTNEVDMSFGCEDSREYGGIPDDKLVLSMPFLKAVSTLRSLAEMRVQNESLIHFVV